MQSLKTNVVALQQQVDRIRSISIIAHVDHGKTTLVDSLLVRGGLLNPEEAGQKRVMQLKKEEQARGITIKSSSVSLVVDDPRSTDAAASAAAASPPKYLINLIDSPGHVDFSAEVSAALRLTDGAVVVLDSVEGPGVQTETVLRQALAERVRPVLHINKLDRAIMELQLEPEELYQTVRRHVESINATLATYDASQSADASFPTGASAFPSIALSPLRGEVSFGSGKQGWAFTLPMFARVLAKKKGMEPDAILKRLWGDHFYDPETKRFYATNKSPSGKTLQRYFCSVVLEPLIRLFHAMSAVQSAVPPELDEMFNKLGIALPPNKRTATGQDLIKAVMSRWLPAADALLEMIIEHLPSPKVAQAYRTDTLYTGPLDDECATSIRRCDPEGPLVMFVSKMVPTHDLKRFIAFGRVFSGTLRTGMKVRILGPEYKHGGTTDLAVNKGVQKVVLMLARNQESIDACPAGNIVGIVGIDKDLVKTGTVTDHPGCWPVPSMKFSVSPVVRVAVEPKNPQDLPKLVDALRLLVKTDPCIQITTSSAGEHIVAGAGELHVEVVINDLREMLGDNVPLIVSDPVVSYCETVRAPSSQTVLSKTANGLNRLFISAQPLGEQLVTALESRAINAAAPTEDRERSQALVNEFGWDANHARKVWFFGPESVNTNAFVDLTVGAQYLNDIKSSVNTGFQWATKEGVLAEEPMRGVRFNLHDVLIHQDPAHRGSGQIIPAARRAIYGSQLTAQPAFMEPMFLVDIQTTSDMVSAIYSVLGRRRGQVIAEEPKPGTPLVLVKAYLPVRNSFGFTSVLREETSGKAFPQSVFSHYATIDDDIAVSGSLNNTIAMETRKRKGLPLDLPVIAKFHDKL